MSSIEASHTAAVRRVPIVMVAIALLGTAVALTFPVNHDAGYMLRSAEHMLQGKQLYRDIINSHPPLTFWFAELIVLASRTAGITPMHGIQVATALLGALSLALCWHLSSDRARLALPAFAFAYFVLPGYRFPQEEVWLVALVSPYALSFDPAASPSRRMQLATGVLAALGFAIKPYFLLAYAALEAYRRDPLRLQNIAIMATGAAYGLAMTVLTPDFFGFAFWTRRVYAPLYHRGPLQIVLNWRSLVVLGAVLLGALYARRNRGDQFAAACVIAALAFLATVFFQAKGFDYHFYPALAFAMLLAGRVLTRRPRALMGASVVASLIGAVLTAAHWRTPDTNRFYLADTLPIVRTHGGPIAVLGTQMRPVWPLANYAGVEVASRFPSFWTLPYVLTQGTPAERAQLRTQVREDFERGHPRVVFVEGKSGALRFLLGDSAFRALWARYRFLRAVGPYGVYVSE